MSFSIPASAGCWAADNPLYPPVESEEPASEGEPLLEVTVPLNCPTAFFKSGSAEVIEVYFDDMQWCWTNLLTGASESGRR